MSERGGGDKVAMTNTEWNTLALTKHEHREMNKNRGERATPISNRIQKERASDECGKRRERTMRKERMKEVINS